MKLELTNPKAWKKISERKLPMESKIKIYEKIGGAYRLGKDGGEQVYNKLSELLKNVLNNRTTISEETGEDHEVSMANGQLDDIIKNSTELKGKIGTDEFNIPGWIQDHISQSQNFINQANTGYHKLDGEKVPQDEYRDLVNEYKALVNETGAFNEWKALINEFRTLVNEYKGLVNEDENGVKIESKALVNEWKALINEWRALVNERRNKK